MPKYIATYSIACMTRQQLEELYKKLQVQDAVKITRFQVSLLEGKLVCQFEAPNRELLDLWLRKQNMITDWIMRVELEGEGGKLIQVG